MGSTSIEWTDKTFPPRHDEARYHRARTSWTQAVWYGQRDLLTWVDGKQKGRGFEIVALQRLLPQHGFHKIVDLADLAPNSPFDFIAQHEGIKVFVDVSTKWQKAVTWKAQFAGALEIPFYVVLICPRNIRFRYCALVSASSKSVRTPVTLIREIATFYGEPDGH